MEEWNKELNEVPRLFDNLIWLFLQHYFGKTKFGLKYQRKDSFYFIGKDSRDD